MARRTATSYRRTAATTTTTEGDTPAARESAAAATTEDKGLGLAEGLILATTVLLFVAIVLTDAYLGKRYGAGMFFK